MRRPSTLSSSPIRESSPRQPRLHRRPTVSAGDPLPFTLLAVRRAHSPLPDLAHALTQLLKPVFFVPFTHTPRCYLAWAQTQPRRSVRP